MPPSSKKKTAKNPVSKIRKNRRAKEPIVPKKPTKQSKSVQKKVVRKIVNKDVLVKSPLSKRSSLLASLGFQVFIAGSAAVVLLALGVVGQGLFATQGTKAADDPPATVGLEHSSPLALSFVITRKDRAGYVNITNDSPETIRVSLPSAWQRVEVRGAELKDVPADFPATDVIRWTLPARASIRLVLSGVPSAVRFDSVTAASAAVTVKSIDLSTEEIRTNVLLLKDRATTRLWEEE